MATRKYFRRRILAFGVLFFLCLFVAAEPFRIANASLTQTSTMPCCVGKAAGHCDSGIAAKQVPPPQSEPMCGLADSTLEDDGLTIVAEPVAEAPPSHSQSAESNPSQPAAESASFNSPCHMDCASCAATASRQQKRERSIVMANSHAAASVTAAAKYEDESLLFSSSDNWPQTVPRGPPARR